MVGKLSKEEHYFMTPEHDVKFVFQCPWAKFYWNTASTLACASVVCGCFKVPAVELPVFSDGLYNHKVQNIYYLTLYRKRLLPLNLRDRCYLFPARRDRKQSWQLPGYGVRTANPEGPGSNVDLDLLSFQQETSRSSRRESLSFPYRASRKK